MASMLAMQLLAHAASGCGGGGDGGKTASPSDAGPEPQADAGPATDGASEPGDAGGSDAGGPASECEARSFGEDEEDRGFGVATDDEGNLYVVGSAGSATREGGATFVQADAAIDSYAPDGSERWSLRLGDAEERYADRARDVATDAGGNVYVVGSFQGRVDLVGREVESAGKVDGFVLSLTGDGSYRWAVTLGGEGFDAFFDVSVGTDGRLYVAGHQQGEASLDGTPVRAEGGEDNDVLAASLSTEDGSPLWTRSYGAGGFDAAMAIAAAPDGGAYVTGQFEDEVDFGAAGVLAVTPEELGDEAADGFVLALSSEGGERWVTRLGGPVVDEDPRPDIPDRGSGVAVDGEGRVFVQAQIAGTGMLAGDEVAPEGQIDILIARLDPEDGSVRWAKTFGSDGWAQIPLGLTAAEDGRVYATGLFGGAVDFGSGSHEADRMGDVYVASFDADGAPRWSRALQGEGQAIGRRVHVRGAQIYVCGEFQSGLDVCGERLASAGRFDRFVAKLPDAL